MRDIDEMICAVPAREAHSLSRQSYSLSHLPAAARFAGRTVVRADMLPRTRLLGR